MTLTLNLSTSHLTSDTESGLGVDRYVFFRADADTDYYRSSRPITDIFNRLYVSGVKMKINAKINNNKSSDKKTL